MKKVSLAPFETHGSSYIKRVRFYYLSARAEAVITGIMKKFPGHFLSQDEEIKYGIYRADRLFGDAIFLLDAGI